MQEKMQHLESVDERRIGLEEQLKKEMAAKVTIGDHGLVGWKAETRGY